jgi:hypothetical protein
MPRPMHAWTGMLCRVCVHPRAAHGMAGAVACAAEVCMSQLAPPRARVLPQNPAHGCCHACVRQAVCLSHVLPWTRGVCQGEQHRPWLPAPCTPCMQCLLCTHKKPHVPHTQHLRITSAAPAILLPGHKPVCHSSQTHHLHAWSADVCRVCRLCPLEVLVSGLP